MVSALLNRVQSPLRKVQVGCLTHITRKKEDDGDREAILKSKAELKGRAPGVATSNRRQGKGEFVSSATVIPWGRKEGREGGTYFYQGFSCKASSPQGNSNDLRQEPGL